MTNDQHTREENPVRLSEPPHALWAVLQQEHYMETGESLLAHAQGLLLLPEQDWAWPGTVLVTEHQLLAVTDDSALVPAMLFRWPLADLLSVDFGAADVIDGYAWRFESAIVPTLALVCDETQEAHEQASRVARRSCEGAPAWRNIGVLVHLGEPSVSQHETPRLQAVSA